MIYRVRDHFKNNYADQFYFSISNDGIFWIFDLEDKCFKEIPKERYSIEWGTKEFNKKFYENDVLDTVSNGIIVLNINSLYNGLLYLLNTNIFKVIGTIHDEEFQYLKEV